MPGFDFPSGYTAFQFVFVLLQAAAFGGVFTGFGIAADFEHGFSRRLLLAAPNRLAILAGYALVGLTRTTFVGALLFAVALATGMRVGGDGVDVLALILLAYLVSLAAAMFAAGVAMRARTLQAGPAMQMPVFLILFLAPVYVPLDLLAGWLHTVASANPFTPLIETGRDFISGSPAPAATHVPDRARAGGLASDGGRCVGCGGAEAARLGALALDDRCRSSTRSCAARAGARSRRTRTSPRAASRSGNSMITTRSGA